MFAENLLNVAVLGSAGVDESSPNGRKAFLIGKLIAEAGGALFTGACLGLPYAAVLGAKSAGGMTIGVSPATNGREHQERYGYHLESGVTLFTGMGKKGRNIILVRSAEVCVFVGGAIGTLNEFTIAHDELDSGCVSAVLTGSGGLSDTYGLIMERAGKSTKARVLFDAQPEKLMEAAFAAVRPFKAARE